MENQSGRTGDYDPRDPQDTEQDSEPSNAGDNPNADTRGTTETPAKPSSVVGHRIIAADSHSAHVFLYTDNTLPVRIAVKPAGAEFRQERSITIIEAKVLSNAEADIQAELPADSFLISLPPNQRVHLELTFGSSIENLALKLV